MILYLSPLRVRKWAETLARTEATVSTAARIRAVAGAVRGALTDAQAAEVENNVAAGEERLAVEFLVDFLLEAEARVTAAVKAEIQALSTFDFQYLTNVYLPRKLRDGDWI